MVVGLEPPIALASDSPFELGPQAPVWLARNLAQPGIPGYVEVNGARIHYLGWGWHDVDRPALVLVHGFRGHAHWWSFLAPFLLATHRVAAIDLTGMGDSAHRKAYDGMTLAGDITGFIDHFNLAPATVIGHSYGGARTLRAAADRPDAIDHAIVVDSYVNFPDSDILTRVAPLSGVRIHADQAAAEARFRLFPPQPSVIDDLLRYVAHHSVHRRSGGWCWKFDPFLINDEELDGPGLLARVKAKVDYVYGELSVVAGGGRAQRIVESTPYARKLVMLPGAHHHLMLDHPLELVTTLQELIA